jgi:uncharacterized membrane protein
VEILDGRRSEAGTPALDRVVFFSDAVFAIAITLLAIDVRLPPLAPHQTNQTLLDALAGLRPAIFAFLLSFAVIAAFWIGHYRTFRVITHVDGRLIVINLLFLLCIAAVPFPTSVQAQQGDLAVSAILYASLGVLTGLASTVLWWYAVHARLVATSVTPRIGRYITYRALVPPIMFAISIPLALVSPTLVWAWWIAIFPVQALISRRFAVHPATEADPKPATTAGR